MPKYKVKDSHTDYPNNVAIIKKVAKNRWGGKVQYIEVCNHDFVPAETDGRWSDKKLDEAWGRGSVKIAFVHGSPEVFTDINNIP